jgi:hypothetical protein
MPTTKKKVIIGTVRVKANYLKAYEKTGTGWKPVKKEFPELTLAAKLFKAHNKFSELIDKKNSKFLKGQLSPKRQQQGARINILPNGEVLTKAYSLFAPHLKIHDQISHDHWDVIYQNKGGTWSYVYTQKKLKLHKAQKYKKVEEFDKNYSKLLKNASKSLSDKEDFMSVPMYTLLKTYMRVGNETYFKAHKHKGLTTLTKRDIKIKGDTVNFNYVGKDGVPIEKSHKFPTRYIARLRLLLGEKRKNDFVFAKGRHPLSEHDFKSAFIRYCGHEFYPHIVRSYYATSKVKSFLAKNRKITKDEMEELFLSIAHDLGHRIFNKKKQEWKEHYTVTVNNYIQPELVDKIRLRIRNK